MAPVVDVIAPSTEKATPLALRFAEPAARIPILEDTTGRRRGAVVSYPPTYINDLKWELDD